MTDLTDIPSDIQPENTIQIKRYTSYKSANNELIGIIGSIAVDDSGRVYFTSGQQNGINIFGPDGRNLTCVIYLPLY